MSAPHDESRPTGGGQSPIIVQNLDSAERTTPVRQPLPNAPAVEYGSGLFPQHAELLAASAVPPEMTRDRGYRSVDTKAHLESLGYTAVQRRVPGLLVPLHSGAGRCVGFQYRPDDPRTTETGRPVKYETPGGQANRLDVPPGVGPKLGDPNVDLWITEGARKADAAAHLGLACVSLSGVWNWRTTNPSGGKVALPDWQDVALNGRRVVLAFDSDSRSNTSVGKALDALAGYLSSKSAHVVVCQLPAAADGKTGLDDYLAAGHSLDDLAALIVEHAEAARPAGKDTAATALVDLVRRRYRLGLSTEDEPFAVPHTGPRVVRPLRGGKGSLRAALAAAYYTDAGRVAPQQALAEALQTVEGMAQELDPEPLHLRVAEHDGALHLDLGDPTGRAVVLSAAGWQVVEQPARAVPPHRPHRGAPDPAAWRGAQRAVDTAQRHPGRPATRARVARRRTAARHAAPSLGPARRAGQRQEQRVAHPGRVAGPGPGADPQAATGRRQLGNGRRRVVGRRAGQREHRGRVVVRRAVQVCHRGWGRT